MSRCPHCDRELPGFQTLCNDCYEKSALEISQPRSFLHVARQFVANPLTITDEDVTEMRRAPTWLVVGFWCGGLLLCWFGGWAKIRYQYSLVSDVVLRGTLTCFAISLVLSIGLARRNLRVYWTAASLMFFLMSIGVSGHLFIGSNAIKTMAKAINW